MHCKVAAERGSTNDMDVGAGHADLAPGAGLQLKAVQIIQAASPCIAPEQPQTAPVLAGTQAGPHAGTGGLHAALHTSLSSQQHIPCLGADSMT